LNDEKSILLKTIEKLDVLLLIDQNKGRFSICLSLTNFEVNHYAFKIILLSDCVAFSGV
jgi:hypothetical protein